MCMVSMVMDYGRQHIPFDQWTKPAFDEYKEILERLNQLDKKLDQPDCHDPAKAEWMKQVEERLSALEKKPSVRDVAERLSRMFFDNQQFTGQR